MSILERKTSRITVGTPWPHTARCNQQDTTLATSMVQMVLDEIEADQ